MDRSFALLPGALNAGFVDELYQRYLQDPGSVGADWRAYFDGLDGAVGADGTARKDHVNGTPAAAPAAHVQSREADAAILQNRVSQLVRAYRVRGHMLARLDPLGFDTRGTFPDLDPAYYGFTETDFDRPVPKGTIAGDGIETVRDVLQRLQNTYCRSIGVQFMHINEMRVREWLQERMESTENRLRLDRREQLRILTRLTDAVIFEEFIQQKYVGAKSFSLEGAESLIPLLDLTIEKAGEQGIVEIVMAMAHRGRLNVLANILGKHPDEIFREFEDVDPHLFLGRGDVKYHLGYSSDWTTAHGESVHLSLSFNPSHLEFVNPVALGRLRAKQDRVGGTRGKRSMALLIHGDASFAGEGVIQEILNLSELEGYTVGGTLHVIVNNQVGFTTSPGEGRSTTYASDVARMLQSPIFHVNGEDPEAVAQVMRLAMDFRYEFARDIVVDMYCYRRRGHNEGDEPSFTQPLLYDAIRQRKPVREAYLEHLLDLGGVTRAEAEEIVRARQERLDTALRAARRDDYERPTEERKGVWSGYVGGSKENADSIETSVPSDRLVEYLHAITRLPERFNLHPRLDRFRQARLDMAKGARAVDWSTAEALAFASLAVEGCRVRLTGQDSERGTFSQRHAVLHDVKDDQRYAPLQHVHPDQAPVEVYNSPLSETSVLGFDYGYSLDYPDGLVLWEAQFGDFVNVAQVMIDQFLASAEEKWNRLSGMVLLLPHGFEGQGPEHASARVERFLSLAAEDNLQVAMPSTPSQYFHLLRRQALRRWRKPLIVFTPKSLLRHSKVASSLQEMSSGGFQSVIGDPLVAHGINRVLLCTGKIYYELLEQREALERQDVAIIRVEELYPMDEAAIRAELNRYPDAELCWVQEEPANMGVWPYLSYKFNARFGDRELRRVSRPESASTATGSLSSHRQEQERLCREAFDLEPER